MVSGPQLTEICANTCVLKDKGIVMV